VNSRKRGFRGAEALWVEWEGAVLGPTGVLLRGRETGEKRAERGPLMYSQTGLGIRRGVGLETLNPCGKEKQSVPAYSVGPRVNLGGKGVYFTGK